MRSRKQLSKILNILLVIFTIIGVIVMFVINAPKGQLSSYGFENFKYYTVLSNVICGVTAAIYLRCAGDKLPEYLIALKLMAAAAVTLTFLTIAAFLGPIYGHGYMYHGANLFFHLIIPIIAIIDFVLLDFGERIPFWYTIIATVPTILYGVCYVINLFVNGIGQWPDTNDWYGFVNWGYPVGFAIFGMITLATFVTACLLRAVNHMCNQKNRKK